MAAGEVFEKGRFRPCWQAKAGRSDEHNESQEEKDQFVLDTKFVVQVQEVLSEGEQSSMQGSQPWFGSSLGGWCCSSAGAFVGTISQAEVGDGCDSVPTLDAVQPFSDEQSVGDGKAALGEVWAEGLASL